MLQRVSEPTDERSSQTGGRSRPREDKIVRRLFGKVCKVLWHKPDAELATIGRVDTRTARRWMRGEADPPWYVVRAVVDRMFEPQ